MTRPKSPPQQFRQVDVVEDPGCQSLYAIADACDQLKRLVRRHLSAHKRGCTCPICDYLRESRRLGSVAESLEVLGSVAAYFHLQIHCCLPVGRLTSV